MIKICHIDLPIGRFSLVLEGVFSSLDRFSADIYIYVYLAAKGSHWHADIVVQSSYLFTNHITNKFQYFDIFPYFCCPSKSITAHRTDFQCQKPTHTDGFTFKNPANTKRFFQFCRCPSVILTKLCFILWDLC